MNDDTTPTLDYGNDVLSTVTAANGLDAEDESGFSQSLLTFAAIMTFLIMIVGICGNFLTVVALLKCPKVRNVAAAFIISLCIADLLFCALVLPFQGLRFVQGGWRHGPVLCRLIPFIQYGNIGVSLLCIAMITINRYVMITHHSCYARIYKRHWIAVMIAACWLVSYGMQLPTLLGLWGRFGYDSRLQTCSIMNDAHGHSSKTFLFITAFVIPCLVIIACYAKIFWVVHESEQRMKRHANKQNSIPNNLRPIATATASPPSQTNGGSNASGDGQTQNPAVAASRVSTDSSSSYSTDVPEPLSAAGCKQPPVRVKDQREVRAKRNEWRITKMVLAIFLSFVVCYLPITIVKVADKHVEHPGLHIFSYIMLYLSACINPIIYVIMNKQYRKAYKTVVLCQPARLLLPFGKSNGANSAAEKWKDTGLSNNHSRTLVSQMSAGAAAAALPMATSSPAPAPAPALAPAPAVTATATPSTLAPTSTSDGQSVPKSVQSLELQSRPPDLISRPNLPPLAMHTSLAPPPPPSVTLAMPQALATSSCRLPPKKSNHSYINNGFNMSGNSSSSSNSSSSGSGNGSLSSGVYRPTAGSLAVPHHRRITMVGDDIILEEEELPPTPILSSPAAGKVTKSPIYMNVDSPKRNQSYSEQTVPIPVPQGPEQKEQAASVGVPPKFPNPKD